MVTGKTVERQTRRLDAQLNRLERDAIKRLDEALRQSALRLEGEVQRLYRKAAGDILPGQSPAIGEARARVLLAQVESMIDITSGAPVGEALGPLFRDVHALSVESALAALAPYERQITSAGGIVPVRTAAKATAVSTRLVEIGDARVANAKARLTQHGREAALKIERHVIDGIVRGQGWRRTGQKIRGEVAITRYSAERIVRTESITASDSARRETFAENGVEYVQRIATQDSRVCPYCAARAGNIYRIDDAPAAIHPNDRCYNVPWRPEWQELGLTDDDWMRQHRREVHEKLKEQGEAPKYGLAPFEKMEGREAPPKPVRTP